MYLKICGLTDPENARVAVESGVDALGIMMNATSPRAISVERAAEVLTEARVAAAEAWRRLDTVLVVSDMPVGRAAAILDELDIDVLQLHGTHYSDQDVTHAASVVDRVWRATSLAVGGVDLQVGAHGEEALLLDAPTGGSGETWDLAALQSARPQGRWLLAGGLDPDNVAARLRAARPWGVDVSSGVESAPGVKDPERIRAFVSAVRSVDAADSVGSAGSGE